MTKKKVEQEIFESNKLPETNNERKAYNQGLLKALSLADAHHKEEVLRIIDCKEEWCGTIFFEGHYKCRPGSLCPICEYKQDKKVKT